MRTTHRCPKCQHPEVLYVPRLRDSDYDEMRLDNVGIWNREANGGFEAYVCRSCGFTELYVKNVAAIKIEELEGAKVLKAAVTLDAYR